MTTKPDLIKWVTDDGAAKITDPGSTKKLAGWLYKEKPPFQFWNWLWNKASKWFLGLQGSYYDIVIGSAAQVTALEATHVLADLIDALAVAGSRVLILDGTHTLLGNLSLTNADLKIKSESPLAILDVSTFTATFSGARDFILLRVTNSGAGDIIVSGAGSIFEGIDVPIANVVVSNGAIARTSGAGAGYKIDPSSDESPIQVKSSHSTAKVVSGESTSATGVCSGGYFTADSNSAIAMYAEAISLTGTCYAIHGISHSPFSKAIFGHNTAISGANAEGGVIRCSSVDGIALHGDLDAVSGVNYGVYGETASASGYDFYAAGAGTNYGPFTGGHDGLVLKDFKPVVGDLVVDVEAINKRNISNCIFEIATSTELKQKNVVGVFSGSSNPINKERLPSGLVGMDKESLTSIIEKFNRTAFNALGEGQINICKEGGNIEAGDFICSSSMPGKGMKQDDDLIHNYTVAKARESICWEENDNSIKQVACIYLAG